MKLKIKTTPKSKTTTIDLSAGEAHTIMAMLSLLLHLAGVF